MWLVVRRGRSPYGERGLKYIGLLARVIIIASLSLRRAWIEIYHYICQQINSIESLSLRRAWIEIRMTCFANAVTSSLSLRRAWIEIRRRFRGSRHGQSLSLRRAWIEMVMRIVNNRLGWSLSLRRAWIEIKRFPSTGHASSRSPYGERGLKLLGRDAGDHELPSLSLRRAWIEITICV